MIGICRGCGEGSCGKGRLRLGVVMPSEAAPPGSVVATASGGDVADLSIVLDIDSGVQDWVKSFDPKDFASMMLSLDEDQGYREWPRQRDARGADEPFHHGLQGRTDASIQGWLVWSRCKHTR